MIKKLKKKEKASLILKNLFFTKSIKSLEIELSII